MIVQQFVERAAARRSGSAQFAAVWVGDLAPVLQLSADTAGVRSVVLDGSVIRTTPRLYTALAQQLDLPRHFGRNLDALYDCLTDLDERVLLVIEHADEVLADQPDALDALVATLGDAAQAEQARHPLAYVLGVARPVDLPAAWQQLEPVRVVAP